MDFGARAFERRLVCDHHGRMRRDDGQIHGHVFRPLLLKVRDRAAGQHLIGVDGLEAGAHQSLLTRSADRTGSVHDVQRTRRPTVDRLMTSAVRFTWNENWELNLNQFALHRSPHSQNDVVPGTLGSCRSFNVSRSSRAESGEIGFEAFQWKLWSLRIGSYTEMNRSDRLNTKYTKRSYFEIDLTSSSIAQLRSYLKSAHHSSIRHGSSPTGYSMKTSDVKVPTQLQVLRSMQ